MKARLLVVEDDPNVAAEVVRGLGAAGFEVELATNGRAGLASYASATSRRAKHLYALGNHGKNAFVRFV